MPINIGDLCYRVSLLKPVEARDAVGGPIETWQLVDTVWAAETDISARDQFMAQNEGYHLTRIVRIRWRSDINESWKVSCHDGRTGRISGISLVGRREGMDLLVEIVNQ